MKERFLRFKEKSPGICKIVSDFYEKPKKKGSVFFVKSPATTDKHWSLCLYPNTNRFTDFANGGLSGDCIAFVAYIRGCNNWEALKILEDFYGLSGSSEQNREEIQRKIRLQQDRERKAAERK